MLETCGRTIPGGETRPVRPLSKEPGPNLVGGHEESRAAECERGWPHERADVLGLRVALALTSARADVGTSAPGAAAFPRWLT